MLKIKYQKIHPDAKTPSYAHDGDSGLDVYALENYELQPLETKLFPIGIKISIPYGYEIQIRPKSGLALKYNITVLNTPGTVDSTYRGELGVILTNMSKKPYRVEKGQKIAQLVFQKVEYVSLEEVVSLDDTKRGEKGFGGTGLS